MTDADNAPAASGPAPPPSSEAATPSTANAKPGSKLACHECGTQVVLVRAKAPELTCCGAVLTAPA